MPPGSAWPIRSARAPWAPARRSARTSPGAISAEPRCWATIASSPRLFAFPVAVDQLGLAGVLRRPAADLRLGLGGIGLRRQAIDQIHEPARVLALEIVVPFAGEGLDARSGNVEDAGRVRIVFDRALAGDAHDSGTPESNGRAGRKGPAGLDHLLAGSTELGGCALCPRLQF